MEVPHSLQLRCFGKLQSVQPSRAVRDRLIVRTTQPQQNTDCKHIRRQWSQKVRALQDKPSLVNEGATLLGDPYLLVWQVTGPGMILFYMTR